MSRFQVIVLTIIIIPGVMLFMATLSMISLLIDLQHEVEKNREIGCINRYIAGDPLAPACDKYVKGVE